MPNYQDKERAKENPLISLTTLKFMWYSLRFHPVTTLLIACGLCMAPSVVWSFFSGLFFGARVVANSPLPLKISNQIGAGIARPIVGTTLISVESVWQGQQATLINRNGSDKLTPQQVKYLQGTAKIMNVSFTPGKQN